MAKWTITAGDEVLQVDFTYQEAHVLQFATEILGLKGFESLCVKVLNTHVEVTKLSRKHTDKDIVLQIDGDEGTSLVAVLPPDEEDD